MINNFTLLKESNYFHPVRKQMSDAASHSTNLFLTDDIHDVKKNNAFISLIHTCSGSKSQAAVLPKLKTSIMKTFLSKYRFFAIALLIANFFLLSGAFAQRYAVASGAWGSITTWDGGTPIGAGQTVTISNGLNVSVSGSQTCAGLTLSSNTNPTPGKGNGTITFNAGSQLTVNGTLTVGNSGFTQTGTVTMTSGGILIVNSIAILGSGGTFTPGTGEVRINATGALPSSVFTTFNNLTISSGTTTSGVSISVGGTLTVNGTFNVTGGTTTLGGSASMTINPLGTFQVTSPGTANFASRPVTIKSDATGTGRIGTLTGATPITNAADVIAERFIPQRAGLGRAYRFLTSGLNTSGSMQANWMEGGQVTVAGGFSDPVPGYGTHITGSGTLSNSFDVTQTNQSSIYTATNGGTSATLVYTPVANANGTLNANQGYFVFVRGNRSESLSLPTTPGMSTSATTLRTTGTILTGTQTNFGVMVGGAGSLNVVTNPYESPIDWSLVQAACTGVTTSYTLWDPNFGTRGGFVTVNTAGTASSGAANQFIQPGQAFFVEASGASAPTVSIQEAHKAAGNNNGVFRPGSLSESFRTELYFTEQPSGFRRIADGVIALYDNSYSAGIDINDASEINNWDENIAIARAGKHLAIESRPVILTRDTLPLFMNNMRQMAYEFEFTPSSFTNTGLKAELIDNFLGTRTVLSVTATTVVSFTVTSDPASSASDRFMVVFGPQTPLAVDLITIRANKVNNGVQVDWTSRTETDMDHYEVERSANGINFAMKSTVVAIGNSNGAVNYSWFDASPQMGNNFYRIKGFDQAGNFKYSTVVKVLFGKDAPGIVVYPNPIVGNSFTLDMNNLDKGMYNISLINKLGQEVFSQAVMHDGGSVMKTITMRQTIPQGTYQLVLKGENGMKLTQQVIKD
jgi:hypothetical protein